MICFDVNINFNIVISLAVGIILGGGGLILFFLKHPEKFEKLVALLGKWAKYFIKSAEYTYIKYDIQGKVNDYITSLSRLIPNLNPSKINLIWIDEHITREQFIKGDKLVLRMQKSNNQTQNLVNASMAYISQVLLAKTKTYIAKYQRDSIDLFVAYKLFEKEKAQILTQFVRDFLQQGLDKTKVAELYEHFFDIDKAGLFFQVFLLEMTFLGEKVFARRTESKAIFEEVSNLILFLFNHSKRKLDEKRGNEFKGTYCKFSIVIVGKRMVIARGKKVYKNYLEKICDGNETLYVVGAIENKNIIKEIVFECKDKIKFSEYWFREYSAVIKNKENNDFNVNNFLLVLRNDSLQVYHR